MHVLFLCKRIGVAKGTVSSYLRRGRVKLFGALCTPQQRCCLMHKQWLWTGWRISMERPSFHSYQHISHCTSGNTSTIGAFVELLLIWRPQLHYWTKWINILTHLLMTTVTSLQTFPTKIQVHCLLYHQRKEHDSIHREELCPLYTKYARAACLLPAIPFFVGTTNVTNVTVSTTTKWKQKDPTCCRCKNPLMLCSGANVGACIHILV